MQKEKGNIGDISVFVASSMRGKRSVPMLPFVLPYLIEWLAICGIDNIGICFLKVFPLTRELSTKSTEGEKMA